MDTTAPPLELEVLADLEEAFARARKILGAGLWHLGQDEVLDVLHRIHRLDGPFQSLRLQVVHEIADRGVPEAVGATGLRSYLASALTMSPGLAGEHAKVSEALATRFTDTATALADGDIAYEQAKAIIDTVDGLPDKAAAQDKAHAEALLLSKASVLNARDIRGLHKKLDGVIDPDGTPDREAAARSKRGASIRDNHNGTQTLAWTDIDDPHRRAETYRTIHPPGKGTLLKAAIEALAAPIPAEDGTRDARTAPVRRADALVDLCRRALSTGELGLSRGVGPHLHVTVTPETLRGEPGAPWARTSTGEDLSPATLARLACDATLTGILLNGAGLPLKVGRAHRTVRPWQWIALVARDTGCQFPACTRPAAWCQAHHLPPWAQGGNTNVEEMGLFCTIHHHYVHDKGWEARMGPDGRIELIPPPWIDPTQQPRRNEHWHIQRQYRDFTTDPDP